MERWLNNRLFLLAFFALGLILVFNLSQLIHRTYQSGQRLAQLKAETVELEEANQNLQRVLAERSDPSYVEGQARQRLHMSKPGETLVIVPEYVPEQGQTEEAPVANILRWQASAQVWVHLFFR